MTQELDDRSEVFLKQQCLFCSHFTFTTDCPEGYTSVFSPEEGQFCYPTSALTSGSQTDSGRAPTRGDAALRCPPGLHSVYC